MKWSFALSAPFRQVAPLLLLALSACSNTQSPTPGATVCRYPSASVKSPLSHGSNTR